MQRTTESAAIPVAAPHDFGQQAPRVGTTRQEVAFFTRETSVGTTRKNYDMKSALQRTMAELKADVAEALHNKTRQQQEQAAREESELLTKAPLADLLVAEVVGIATQALCFGRSVGASILI